MVLFSENSLLFRRFTESFSALSILPFSPPTLKDIVDLKLLVTLLSVFSSLSRKFLSWSMVMINKSDFLRITSHLFANSSSPTKSLTSQMRKASSTTVSLKTLCSVIISKNKLQNKILKEPILCQIYIKFEFSQKSKLALKYKITTSLNESMSLRFGRELT